MMYYESSSTPSTKRDWLFTCQACETETHRIVYSPWTPGVTVVCSYKSTSTPSSKAEAQI